VARRTIRLVSKPFRGRLRGGSPAIGVAAAHEAARARRPQRHAAELVAAAPGCRRAAWAEGRCGYWVNSPPPQRPLLGPARTAAQVARAAHSPSCLTNSGLAPRRPTAGRAAPALPSASSGLPPDTTYTPDRALYAREISPHAGRAAKVLRSQRLRSNLLPASWLRRLASHQFVAVVRWSQRRAAYCRGTDAVVIRVWSVMGRPRLSPFR